ncbi:hypothetical protein WG66_003926 [Moniliophthora roreri]|nr:hypothetical protein WG66_003926 [Moniliophthora roreri]
MSVLDLRLPTTCKSKPAMSRIFLKDLSNARVDQPSWSVPMHDWEYDNPCSGISTWWYYTSILRHEHEGTLGIGKNESSHMHINTLFTNVK